MSQRIFFLTSLLVCIFAVALPQAVNADERPGGREGTLPVTIWNNEYIVADTVVAIVSAETALRPLNFAGYTLTPAAIQSLTALDSNLVMYDIQHTSDTIDYGFVINFLQTIVPGSCADTNLVHGSPNSWNTGSAYDIVDLQDNNPLQFTKQWAWDQIDYMEPDPTSSDNTTVAILDVFADDTATLWGSSNITFHAPATVPPLTSAPSLPDMSQHGNVILSIVEHMSPVSDYMAVSTLNENGQGYTFGVIQALDYVLTQFESSENEHLVINMSFGAERSDRCGIIEALLSAGKEAYDVVYVAAAGNNANGNMSSPAQFPAQLEIVIATAASTVMETMASYSQQGNFMAPGGDEPYPGAEHCQDKNTSIIGYIPVENGVFTTVATCGTSFAAAFVSGGAAYWFGFDLNAPTVETQLKSDAVNNGNILNLGQGSVVD